MAMSMSTNVRGRGGGGGDGGAPRPKLRASSPCAALCSVSTLPVSLNNCPHLASMVWCGTVWCGIFGPSSFKLEI